MQRFSLRSGIFFSALLALFALLFVRLTDLQVLQGSKYTKMAENNRYYSQLVPARRGIFLDRYGDPLVWNLQTYDRKLQPQALYSEIQPIERDQALALLATDSAAVELNVQRLYRYPQSLAHTVGYVGEVTADDLRRDDTLKVGQQVGKAGLELVYNQQLRGVDGTNTFEVNALGQRQRLVDHTDAQPGQDLQTSLDPYLTEIASRYLQGNKGAVVMTDATNGRIIALTSLPTFDPNVLSQSFADKTEEAARKEEVARFFSDPNQLFFNRAISGVYPPGSIFKIATALAGLASGKIDANTQVVDAGKIVVAGYEFGNWYYRQYGRVEGSIGLVRAITRSNDIYFYKVAEWAGPNAVADMARLLGLGGKTGIDLPAEAKGVIPDPDWKAKVKHEQWYLGDTYHMGIGQGDILTSPIQIAQLTQAVANSGSLCRVSIVQSNDTECRDIGVPADNLKLVWDGMVGVCSSGGTAFPIFPYNAKRIQNAQTVDDKLANGAVACKTGTAEFGPANAQGVRKTHGWLTSFFTLPNLQAEFSQSTASASASLAATVPTTPGTVAALSDAQLYQAWRQQMAAHGFPSKVTLTILVESDDQHPYREGSADAGPIAKKIITWMTGG